jgi:hypothetical protein
MTEEDLVNYAMILSMESTTNPGGPTSGRLGVEVPSRLPPSGSRRNSIQNSINNSPRNSRPIPSPVDPSRSSPRQFSRSSSSWRNEWDDDEEDEQVEAHDLETSAFYSPRSYDRSMENDWTLEAPELSTSGGKRRLFYGMSSSTSNSRTTSNQPSSRYASSAAGILLRSPGLHPVSPGYRQSPSRQPMGNVTVAQRPSAEWDDEELQYVLELSMLEK